MDSFVSIGKAASVLGVSVRTLRRSEAAGRLIPMPTSGGHRRYDLAKLKPDGFRARGGRRTDDQKASLGTAEAGGGDVLCPPRLDLLGDR